MNARERFLEVMQFNKNVSVPKWEFGYWGEVIDVWYDQGLPKRNYPMVPDKITSPSMSMTNIAWHSLKTNKLPPATAVCGGGLYQANSFPVDSDVRDELSMDKGQVMVDINTLFYPAFDFKVWEEDNKHLVYTDLDGVKKMFVKDPGNYPSGLEYVIRDRKSWETLKRERLGLDHIRERLGPEWDRQVGEYRKRDYPILLGGFPNGYFGALAQLMGYENLFYAYYDVPDLIHDILSTFTELWLALYEEVFTYTDVDLYVIWEDFSAGKGPMISPTIIKKFMLPYYKRLTDFLKGHGVKAIFVDTDGYCFEAIPLLIQGGATGLYPIEVSCGMDLVRVRKTFPELLLMGGVPKFEIAHGRERIDQILEPVAEVLKTGGYIPFGDHLISPGVSWQDFKYYREKLNHMCDHPRG